MAKGTSRQGRVAAAARARERRMTVDADRAARDRRIEEALTDAFMEKEERAELEAAVAESNARLGEALRRLMDDEQVGLDRAALMVGMTPTEVRRIARSLPELGGEARREGDHQPGEVESPLAR